MTGIWAHRGYSAKAPENSMAAFQMAVDAGAEGIETDLQLSQDGVLVLSHDDELGRCINGSGSIGQYTWADLKKLDCGSFFSERFSGETLPRLEDLLDLLKPTGLKLNLEIKTGAPFVPGMEEILLGILEQYSMKDRCILSSFNHYSLERLRELDKDISLGVLSGSLLLRPWKYVKELKAQAYHPHYRALLPDHCKKLQEQGIQINTYTVDGEENLKRLLSMKPDNIISNDPAEALRIRNLLGN